LENSVYCKTCVLFASLNAGHCSSQALNQLVKTGYNNWKKYWKKCFKTSLREFGKI